MSVVGIYHFSSKKRKTIVSNFQESRKRKKDMCRQLFTFEDPEHGGEESDAVKYYLLQEELTQSEEEDLRLLVA